MMLLTISMHTIKKAMLFFLLCFIACFLSFFIIGFIFYTPAQHEPFYDSITIHIEKPPDEAFSAIEDQGQTGEEKETVGDQRSSAAGRFPLLQERPGKVEVAAQYRGLLAQMDSILEDMTPVQAAEAAYDPYDLTAGFMQRDEISPAVAGVSVSDPVEEMIRERMVMIEDELEYASSQVGIPVDLLAAVAWAECKMLPYAINVQGKAYHFTSRERALKMLRSVETDDIDIGLFQVNYRLWGEPLGLKKEDLLNSRVCAIMGALILQYNLQRHRDPWVAIGRYHSGDAKRMRAYQARVSEGLVLIRAVLAAPQEEGFKFSEVLWKKHRDSALHNKKHFHS
jgi:hypothetical protein